MGCTITHRPKEGALAPADVVFGRWSLQHGLGRCCDTTGGSPTDVAKPPRFVAMGDPWISPINGYIYIYKWSCEWGMQWWFIDVLSCKPNALPHLLNFASFFWHYSEYTPQHCHITLDVAWLVVSCVEWWSQLADMWVGWIELTWTHQLRSGLFAFT